MISYYLILIGLYSVLTINNELINFEENLLYKHIKTQTNLDSFYRQLIKSNKIDDLKSLQNIINENDIRNLNIEHKVNILFLKMPVRVQKS